MTEAQDAGPMDRLVSAQQLQRFDQPRPRYTSYPTALEFSESVGLESYESGRCDDTRCIETGQLSAQQKVLQKGEDSMHRELIHGLMCNFHVSKAAIGERHQVNSAEVFAEDQRRLEPMVESGLAIDNEHKMSATPKGELFVRNLARSFDIYWRLNHEGQDSPTLSLTA
jgi:coproporphyrinogen III oxidase-like Fe-S oxidoreductase